MKRWTTIWSLVVWLFAMASGSDALAAPAQAAAPARKACDFLTKADAEALLGTTVQDRSQGADCFFVERGWTNKPPRNKAIRFGLTDSASPRPDEVVTLRRNNEQYVPPGAFIRDIPGFADAAYWLWIPGFGGTLTAFRGGTTTVSVNITGLPEDEALRKAEALAAKPLGGSAPTGFAYNKPAPPARPTTNASGSPAPAAPPTRSTPASATVVAKATNPRCTEAPSAETIYDRFAATYSFKDGPTLREYSTLSRAQQATFIINCVTQMAPGYAEGAAILAKFNGPASQGVDQASHDVALALGTVKGTEADERPAASEVKRRFIYFVLAGRLTAPTNDAWVDSVMKAREPVLLKGLFNRDFRAFAARRTRAYGYILGFNERIADDCESVFDGKISDDALVEETLVGGAQSDADEGQEAGDRDGQVLIALSPGTCNSGLLRTIINGMRGYLASRK